MPAAPTAPRGPFPLSNKSVGRRWATITEVADYLGVHPVTVKHMISDGRITAYRLGARICRIDLDEVDSSFQPYGGAV